jgi:cytochrome c5
MHIVIVFALALLSVAAAKPKPVKLPKGPGQTLVQTKCISCHALPIVLAKRKTEDEWDASLNQMVSRGAKLNDDEYDIVLAYLVKNFGMKK